MIQVLLVVNDKNSIDLIKALCLYKGCKVLVADNPQSLLHFLHEETIDIIFFDLSSEHLSAFDLIFSVCDFDKIPAILISQKINHSEETELLKRNIFYRLAEPLNSEEIDQVIDAAIKAVQAKMPEKEYFITGKMVAGDSGINKQMKQKTSRKVFRSVYRNIQNYDRRTEECRDC